jgi:hypothetical protein
MRGPRRPVGEVIDQQGILAGDGRRAQARRRLWQVGLTKGSPIGDISFAQAARCRRREETNGPLAHFSFLGLFLGLMDGVGP